MTSRASVPVPNRSNSDDLGSSEEEVLGQIRIDVGASVLDLLRHLDESFVLDGHLGDGDGFTSEHRLVDDGVSGEENGVARENSERGVGGVENVSWDEGRGVDDEPCGKRRRLDQRRERRPGEEGG